MFIFPTCHSLGILTKGFFIIGNPEETLKTLDNTIDFAISLKIDDIVATINTPIPGSYQYDHAEEYGTMDISNWSKFNYWNPVFVPHGLSREVLLKKHQEIYRRFYLRPRILWRYFKSFLSPTGVKRLLTILRASIFLLKKHPTAPNKI